MHNGELAKKCQVSPLTRKECPTKLGCHAYVKQMFRTWMKILLHCGFGESQVNKMELDILINFIGT